MARARNIKPGFFRSADLVELPFEARLLFVGLWTVADRAGRMEDRPKQIKMELFPADNLDCDALLSQLAAIGMIERYEHGGKRYLHITNFVKHQNPHRDEKASTLPSPSGFDVQTVATPAEHGANTVQAPVGHGANTVAIGLNPESRILIPDSLTDTGAGKPAFVSQAAKTLKTALAECELAGTKVVPDDHPVRQYCVDAGITEDMAAVAWRRFCEDHLTGTRKSKRYADWAVVFADSVKDRWYRLWTVNPDGEADWTSAGLQACRVLDAQRDAAEAAAVEVAA